MDPVASFLIVIAIGAGAGFLYERFAGPGWLTRQFAGERRGVLTYGLIGVAGSFIGYSIFALLGLGSSVIVLYIGAAIGAGAVLWAWRSFR